MDYTTLSVTPGTVRHFLMCRVATMPHWELKQMADSVLQERHFDVTIGEGVEDDETRLLDIAGARP